MNMTKWLIAAALAATNVGVWAAEFEVTERNSYISVETLNLGGVEFREETFALTAPFDAAINLPLFTWEEPGGDDNMGQAAIGQSVTITPTSFVASAATEAEVDSNGSGGGPLIRSRAETAIEFSPTEDAWVRIEGTFVGISSVNQGDPRTIISLQPLFQPVLYNNQTSDTPWVGFLTANRTYRLLMFSAISVAGNAPDSDTASFDYSVAIVPDTDDDGVQDVADNCVAVVNADQRDTDGDDIGNACDADFNQDCTVNVIDLGLLRVNFFSSDPDTDLNGDGVVNVVDLGLMRAAFFSTPGPSGIAGNLCEAARPPAIADTR